MNYSTILFITLLTSAVYGDFTPVIRQTTTFDDGTQASVKYLENVTGLQGTAPAIEAVSKSALFELYSVDSNNNTKEHGKQAVATYLPEASLEIVALDQSNGIPKTRVSSTFSVKLTVSGLVTNDPTVQDAAKWVNVYHSYTEYASGATGPDGQEVLTDSNTPTQISTNGTQVLLDKIITQIPSSDLPSLRGEENITVLAQPDFGFQTPTELASAKIIVWPLTYGQLSGIENNTEVQVVDTITASLTNIYPGHNDFQNVSSWNVLCYSGSKLGSINSVDIDNHNVTSRSTTTETVPTSIANRKVNMKRLKRVVTNGGAGTYTVELVQTSVHGIDRLDSITFDFDPKIRINTNVNSAE